MLINIVQQVIPVLPLFATLAWGFQCTVDLQHSLNVNDRHGLCYSWKRRSFYIQIQMAKRKRGNLWNDFDNDAKYVMKDKWDEENNNLEQVETATQILKKLKAKAGNEAQELRSKLDEVDNRLRENHKQAQILLEEVQRDVDIQRILRAESKEAVEKLVALKKEHIFQLNQARQHYETDRKLLNELYSKELENANGVIDQQHQHIEELEQQVSRLKDDLQTKCEELSQCRMEQSSIRSMFKKSTLLTKERISKMLTRKPVD